MLLVMNDLVERSLAVSRMFGGVIIVLEVFRGDLERRGWGGGVGGNWRSVIGVMVARVSWECARVQKTILAP